MTSSQLEVIHLCRYRLEEQWFKYAFILFQEDEVINQRYVDALMEIFGFSRSMYRNPNANRCYQFRMISLSQVLKLFLTRIRTRIYNKLCFRQGVGVGTRETLFTITSKMPRPTKGCFHVFHRLSLSVRLC